MAHNCHYWKLINAWVSRNLAVEDAERLMWSVMSLRQQETAKNPPTKWRFWEERSVSRCTSLGTHFPGKIIRFWAANSVGGIDGNPWSYVAVAELSVQGTILDQIAENV
jgi:hypothetical protein